MQPQNSSEMANHKHGKRKYQPKKAFHFPKILVYTYYLNNPNDFSTTMLCD
jgi:hypothetical protein